jgi:hypothetical protein
MRYAAAEKLEIIRLVEQSSLSVRRTLGSWAFRAPPSIAGTIAIEPATLKASRIAPRRRGGCGTSSRGRAILAY